MASITLSQPAQEALSPRTPASEPGPAAVAAKPALVETTDAPRTEVASGKVEVSLDHAQELMDAIKEIHGIFWGSKDKDVAWYTA